MDETSFQEKFAKITGFSGELQSATPPEYILRTGICKIGRAPDCNIIITDRDEMKHFVSRLHAVIEFDEDLRRYKLYDKKSTNGTFVNSKRVQNECLLENNDLIGIGSTEAILRFNDPDATTAKFTRLRYDEKVRKFFVEQKPLKLSREQFCLLTYLHQHSYTLCSRENCARAIWDSDYNPALDDDALNQAVYKLRTKLKEAVPGAEELIQTEPGRGYILLA